MKKLALVALVLALLVTTVPASSGSDRVVTRDARISSMGEVETALAAVGTSSITFIKNGNVFIQDPDAGEAHQVTSGAGYAWPTQDDSGVIVAVRQTQEDGRSPRRLHRMDRNGNLLNPPVETVPTDNSLYVGPLMPEVSPDGQHVAYHYFWNGGGSGNPTVCYARSDQDDVVHGELGCMSGYLSPSWLDSSYVINFAVPSFSEQVFLDQVGNVDSTFWFSDTATDSLAQGEVSRDMSRFAAVITVGDVQYIRLYELTGTPPAPPEPKCDLQGPTGYFQEPTWSPDGSLLMWEEGDGIWGASVPNLDDCTSIAAALLIPQGQDPDWSPASFVAPLEASMRIGSRQSLDALLGGLKPKVTCSRSCSIKAKLIAGATTVRRYDLGSATVGDGSGSLAAAGTRAVTVSLTRSAKRKLRGATRSFDLTLKVTATGGTSDVVKKTLTIVP